MKQIPMTVAGVEKLRRELDYLRGVLRPQIVRSIAEARRHGDLRENAEYHAARERQSFCEGRIRELEGKLSRVLIVDVSRISPRGRVVFGAAVKVVDLTNDEERSYRIVGDDEVDLRRNLISVSSPVGRALLGREEGEELVIQTPRGELRWKILRVSRPVDRSD